jgi:outer membrane lipopolysaccharide assembly protein LptE/RlpB
MNTRLIKNNVVTITVTFVLSTFFCGCGYQLQGSGSVLPPEIKRVYIPIVENDTTDTSLTQLVTESLRDRFERFGVVTVVEESNEADAILRARIKNVRRDTRSVTSDTDSALQFDLTLGLAAELQQIDGPILWRNRDLRVVRAAGATGDVVVTNSADFASGGLGSGDLAALDNREVSRGQEQEAFQQLADSVAKLVYDEAVAPDF